MMIYTVYTQNQETIQQREFTFLFYHYLLDKSEQNPYRQTSMVPCLIYNYYHLFMYNVYYYYYMDVKSFSSKSDDFYDAKYDIKSSYPDYFESLMWYYRFEYLTLIIILRWAIIVQYLKL